MPDLAPRAVQALIGILQRFNKILPRCGRGVGGHTLDHGIAFRQQRIHSGGHVFGFDVRKARQTGKAQ